jgi:hypothetical protein
VSLPLAHMHRKVFVPKTGTASAKDFYSSWHDINRLFDFVLYLAGSADKVSELAHRAIVSVEDDTEKKAEMESKWKSRQSALDELKRNRQLFVETILVRHIENFINYLSSVLFEIFVSRPETLKSSDKVEISKVLEHESIDSLVREIAETKVNSLSYSSFAKLAEHFQDRFHISLASAEDVAFIHEYIEIRNISVHNRCCINKRFIARTGLDESKLGKKKELYGGDLDRLIPKLVEVVAKIDLAVRRKMKVKGVRFNVGEPSIPPDLREKPRRPANSNVMFQEGEPCTR